jgi:hypothetical protein
MRSALIEVLYRLLFARGCVNARTQAQVCYDVLGWNRQRKRRPGAPRATWRRTVMRECQLDVKTEKQSK